MKKICICIVLSAISSLSFAQFPNGKEQREPTAKIRIAGTTDKPLFLIDSVEVDDVKVKDLDPNEIESITVLKGEDAQPYGDKGQYGVILIRTKEKVRTKQKPR